MPTPLAQRLSRTLYTTDGTTTVWDFAFSDGYLDAAHVKARVDTPEGLRTELVVTPLMLIGEFQLEITPALAAGDVLTIYRDTPKDAPLVNFTDESGFSEIALDTNARQAVMVAAETADEVNTSDIGVASEAAIAAATSAAAALASQTAAASSAVVANSAKVAAEAARDALFNDLASSAVGKGAELVSAVGGIGEAVFSTVKGFINRILSSVGASLVGFIQSGTGAVATTVQAKLRESVSVKDFGAVGDGTTDDTAAIQAALFSGHNTVHLPTGVCRITAKLLIPAQVALVGDTTGIGSNGARGSTLLADDSLTDFILENWSITATPSDPWWHGGRVEFVQFRGNSSLKTASGFNVGPCGDNSSIKNCKFLGLNVGLKVGGTGSNQGVQVSCSLDTISFYASNTGLLFDTCSFTAGVRNIMLDSCTIPVHFKNCGATFHCNIDQWHAENLPAATEIFYVDNCNNSYHEVRSGSAETAGASATISVVRITRTTAPNKARVKVANTYTTTNSNYILKDDDLSVSWTQTELGLSYGEICHNLNTVLNSGQGGQIFGKSYSGTWVPVVADAVTGGNVGAATVVSARFQRIGGMVFVQGNLTSINTTGMTAGSALFIQGLPFTSNGTFNRQVGSAVASSIASGSVYACTVSGSATALRLTKTNNTDVLVSDVTSGSGLAYFNIAYAV